MPMLTPNSVHIDQPLTNLTVAYMQSTDNFVADRVFPNVPVQSMTDKYYIYDRENFNRSGERKPLAPGTAPERVGMAISTDSYSVKTFGMAHAFDFQTLANADDPLQLRSAAANQLQMLNMIDRELDWMSNYFATGIWDTEYTGVGSSPSAGEVIQWDDYTNSTPIVDVRNAKRAATLAAGGFTPNVMVVTRDVHDTLCDHPDILDRLNGGATTTNPALAEREELARIFAVDEYMVIDAIHNTAAEGAAESNAYVAEKKAALYYRPVAPGLMVPAAGYNFVWDALENSSGYGVNVLSFENDELARQGIAQELQVIQAYDQKVVSSEMGVFFNTILG